MSVKNLKKELEQFVPQDTMEILYILSEAAEKLPVKIFLIGGAVRDIIRGTNHFDTDITVQGNAVDFAYFLEQQYPDICKIKEIHESFKTAKIIFTLDNKNQTEIDLASTRKESYPFPSSLPKIEEIGCELYEDVIRRDFSINSMALSLNKESFGDLTDYLGGYENIIQKKIRILHNKSFIDDPTRIIRALKFRVRFGYELDDQTKILQEECLASKMFDNLCGERIKSELKQTFNLNNSEALQIFINENIYRLVDKDIKVSENIEILSENCKLKVMEYFDYINPDFVWLIYLGIIISEFSKEKIKGICDNLYLSGMESDILTDAKTLMENAKLIAQKNTDFDIYESFEGFSPESILISLIKTPELSEKATLYLKELKDTKIFTTGQNLIDLGLEPGPVFGEILRELLKAKINGKFSSKEEEIQILPKIIKNILKNH